MDPLNRKRARQVLKDVAAEFTELLDQHDYVRRLLVREGTDPEHARAMRDFLSRGGPASADCLEDQCLHEHRRIVAIGNAGAGKTLTLMRAFVDSAETFLSDPPSAPLPIWLDLGQDLGTHMDIERALRTRGLWDIATGGDLQVALFLDTLDEALAPLDQPHRLVVDLEDLITENVGILARVAIGCRRPAWWSNYFGKCDPPFEAYSLDSLGAYEWRSRIPDAEQRERFSQLCSERGIRWMLDNAFDGFYLADEFLAERELPATRRECFDRRISAALTGGRRSSTPAAEPAADRLRYLAGQLACVATFTPKSSWDVQEAHDLLNAGTPAALPQPPASHEVQSLLGQPFLRRSQDKFAFTHQLFREYLAAEALERLSLRKQRQLLEAPVAPGKRVCYPLRNVAALLAEGSPQFQEHLIEHDPVVAFLAETPRLEPEADERLTRRIIDDAVRDHRSPWWDVTPKGEDLADALPQHAPADVASFLALYLESQEEIALIWATECAVAWGGSQQLNSTLVELAHNAELNTTIRFNAVKAIAATNDAEAIRLLFDLLDDEDDEVRGAVLAAYRETASPCPADYITKLRGGRREPDLMGVLLLDPLKFASALDETSLGEAFHAALEQFEAMGNLREHLVPAILERAAELCLDDIPPRLFLRLCELLRHDVGRERYRGPLTKALSACPSLLAGVFDAALCRLVRPQRAINAYRLGQLLGTAADDTVFDMLPATDEGLTCPQLRLIDGLIDAHFVKDRSPDRLRLFRSRAPAFTADLRLPEPPPPEPLHDIGAQRQRMLELIAIAEGNPIGQAHNVVLGVAEMEHGKRRLGSVTTEDVGRVVKRLGTDVAQRVSDVFTQSVERLEYGRKPKSGEGRGYIGRAAEHEVAFWYLKERGVTFSADKIAQVVCCYAFVPSADNERYLALVEELRVLDPSAWQRTVRKLLEDPLSHPDRLVEYLIGAGEGFYSSRCAQRLRNGWVVSQHLDPLLRYIDHFRPDGFEDALWDCYQLLRRYVKPLGHAYQPTDRPNDPRLFPDLESFNDLSGMDVLLKLLARNDDRAWDELEQRVVERNVPTSGLDWWISGRWPRWRHDPHRAPILANWFALVQQGRDGEGFSPHDLAEPLLQALIDVGGNEQAIAQLNRLRQADAFPGAKWLSHHVQRIENNMLAQPRGPWQTDELLRFLNRETFRAINCEADLLECVCEAMEELQTDFARAEGVAGFWDGAGPKLEPGCQNVLWWGLKKTLLGWGVSTVEEKLIGRNPVDFWVELPRADAAPLRVAVELKTARKQYGRSRLVRPIRGQLWRKYMQPSGSGHGVYVVMWFKDDDRYRYPRAWASSEDLRSDLQQEADAVARENSVGIRCYVIDVSARPRRV